MQLHSYDRNTKEYTGTFPASLDPLESKIQGKDVFLIPAFSTPVPPCDSQTGEVAVFDETTQKWNLIKDNRGIYYDKTTQDPVEVVTLGDPAPANATKIKPTDPFEAWSETKGQWVLDPWRAVREKRGQLLYEADTAINIALDNGFDTTQLRIYRQALRDVTKQPDPNNVVWPKAPV